MSLKLDLGCGPYKKPGYFGIDIEYFFGVDMVTDIQDRIPFEDNCVDLINCTQVLEHLEDPLSALKEMYRVGKEDVRITMSIPNNMHFRRFLRWMIKGKITVGSGHIQGWGLPELINLAARANLIYFYHYFDSYKRYHKLNIIEKLIKSLIPRVGNKSLVVIFLKGT